MRNRGISLVQRCLILCSVGLELPLEAGICVAQVSILAAHSDLLGPNLVHRLICPTNLGAQALDL